MGEPGRVQGRDRVGIAEGAFGYRARGVSIRGKSVLSRNLGYEGVAMLLNVVLNDPLCQSSGTGPSASCGYSCALCPTRGRFSGKIRFVESKGVNGLGKPVSGSPQQRYATGEPRKVQERTMWGL